MEKSIRINRHSPEIDEIITKVPSWIVRWGIVLFGAILLMILSISAVIRYPDTIKLPLYIKNTNPANEMVGLVFINQESYNKVKIGQHVIVKLTIYPNEQYSGIVSGIATTPNEHGMFAVLLKLNTATHPIKNWMTGQANIITQDMSVLQRITKSLIKLQ